MNTVQFKFSLGDQVKDQVHGLTGVITGCTQWLTGCNSYVVNPQELKDGKPVEGTWIDENRLELVKAGAVKVGNAAPQPVGGDRGGPHDVPERRRG